MTQVVIENPIINSPFDEPTRHFRFTDEGITNEEVDGRRTSSYFVPIAKPKKKGKQLQFDTEWTQDRIEENKLVNDIRRRVGAWREGGYVGVTPTTARLIAYWTDPTREKKLFFCQNEALQTAIYIAEVSKKYGDAWIDNALRDANDTSNPGLPRTAFKMATGTGKTVVMATRDDFHRLHGVERNLVGEHFARLIGDGLAVERERILRMIAHAMEEAIGIGCDSRRGESDQRA